MRAIIGFTLLTGKIQNYVIEDKLSIFLINNATKKTYF